MSTSTPTLMPVTRPRRRRTAVAAVTAVMLVGGGAAFAYWSATGTGSGTGTTGTTAPVTVVQTSTITDLRPGGTAQALTGNFTNPNTGPAYVTSVTASITVVKAVGAPAGTCDASDYTLTGSPMTVNLDVPAGTGKGAWTGATVAFNNKPTNQDACKNAAVTFNYTSN
jgi:hypothetical protein